MTQWYDIHSTPRKLKHLPLEVQKKNNLDSGHFSILIFDVVTIFNLKKCTFKDILGRSWRETLSGTISQTPF